MAVSFGGFVSCDSSLLRFVPVIVLPAFVVVDVVACVDVSEIAGKVACVGSGVFVGGGVVCFFCVLRLLPRPPRPERPVRPVRLEFPPLAAGKARKPRPVDTPHPAVFSRSLGFHGVDLRRPCVCFWISSITLSSSLSSSVDFF